MQAVYETLITVNGWTFLAQLCNLLIQIVIFKKFLLEPVHKVIAERKAKADSQIADAEKAREEAEAMKAEYEKNMADAKAEANGILSDAQKTATARSEAIVGEARSAAAQIKQKAEEDIALEKKKAINEVKDEIGGMAMEIASKVVEREIDQKDHQGLIDEFIKNVGEAS
jgi:F-type H+-transporting ATPase subunit b